MQRDLFIHVGYQKTGSTWLQDNFFSQNEEIAFIGKPTEIHPESLLFDIKREILKSPNPKFNPKSIRKQFNRIVNQLPDDRPLVLSLEQLSGGHLWVGEHHPYVANRLRETFSDFDVHIIAGIRNQLTILPSFYAQYVKHGGTLPPQKFFFHPESPGKILIETLKYNHLLVNYRKHFGQNNIFIFLQEQLAESQKKTTKKLCEFMGIHPQPLDSPETQANPSPTKVGLGLLRLANHFFYSPENMSANLSPLTFILKPFLAIINQMEIYGDRVKDLNEHPLPASKNTIREFRVHTHLRKNLQNLLLTFDNLTLRKLFDWQYELPEKWSEYFADYYSSCNQTLERKYELPLADFDYPLTK